MANHDMNAVYKQYNEMHRQMDEIVEIIHPYIVGWGDNKFAPDTPKEIIELNEKMREIKKEALKLEFLIMTE